MDWFLKIIVEMWDQFVVLSPSQMISQFGAAFLIMGVLAMDNVAVLGVMASKLPPVQRRKALRWGLYGAIFFRIAVIFCIAQVMQMWWLKPIGGLYLAGLAVYKLWHKKNPTPKRQLYLVAKLMVLLSLLGPFWSVIIQIELMDLVFSADSIIAGVAFTQVILILIAADLVCVVIMRYLAQLFAWLIDRYPGLEKTGYHLVLLIGAKLLLEGLHVVEFHSNSPLFWMFWVAMVIVVAIGIFEPYKKIQLWRETKKISPPIPRDFPPIPIVPIDQE